MSENVLPTSSSCRGCISLLLSSLDIRPCCHSGFRSCCCSGPVVAPVLLLLRSCCCSGPIVAPVLLLLRFCCCSGLHSGLHSGYFPGSEQFGKLGPSGTY